MSSIIEEKLRENSIFELIELRDELVNQMDNMKNAIAKDERMIFTLNNSMQEIIHTLEMSNILIHEYVEEKITSNFDNEKNLKMSLCILEGWDRRIFKEISFEVNGIRVNDIKKQEDSKILYSYDSPWNRKLISSYRHLHLSSWKSYYSQDPYSITILDGTSWTFEISIENQIALNFSGSNAYPVLFHRLENMFRSAV